MRRVFGCVGFVGVLVAAAVAPTYAVFSLPDEIVTDCSSTVVNISTTDAEGTLGFDIDVSFESAMVTVDSVSLDGTLTAGCQHAYNETEADVVRISIACTTPINGSGVIAKVTFVPVSEGSTDLSFVECDLDEDPCSATVDGSLTVSGCPSIDLSNSGNGTHGLSPGRVCLAATLASNGASVASASTEMTFDSSKFAIESCSINPSVATAGKSLSRTTLGAGQERITISGGAANIPNGTLFICTLTIVAGVANGPYVVSSVPSTQDASSNALPTSGDGGTLNVTSCAADCNGSGDVRINEVSRTSSLFLSDPLCNPTNPALSCPNADMVVVNGSIAINEVSRASCLFLNSLCSKTCP